MNNVDAAADPVLCWSLVSFPMAMFAFFSI